MKIKHALVLLLKSHKFN